jgi:hypothetical protein
MRRRLDSLVAVLFLLFSGFFSVRAENSEWNLHVSSSGTDSNQIYTCAIQVLGDQLNGRSLSPGDRVSFAVSVQKLDEGWSQVVRSEVLHTQLVLDDNGTLYAMASTKGVGYKWEWFAKLRTVIVESHREDLDFNLTNDTPAQTLTPRRHNSIGDSDVHRALVEPFVANLEVGTGSPGLESYKELLLSLGRGDPTGVAIEDLGGTYSSVIDSDNIEQYMKYLILVHESGLLTSNSGGLINELIEEPEAYKRVFAQKIEEYAKASGLVPADTPMSHLEHVFYETLMIALGQDYTREYGSLENLKASIAIQFSDRVNEYNRRVFSTQDLIDDYNELRQVHADAIYDDVNAVNPDVMLAFNYALVLGHGKGVGNEFASYVFNDQSPVYYDNGVLKSSNGDSLYGLSLFDISEKVFGVPEGMHPELVDELTHIYRLATQLAMEDLGIDSLYPYGSVDNVKATIARRLVGQVDDADIDYSKLESGDWSAIFDMLAPHYNGSQSNFDSSQSSSSQQHLDSITVNVTRELYFQFVGRDPLSISDYVAMLQDDSRTEPLPFDIYQWAGIGQCFTFSLDMIDAESQDFGDPARVSFEFRPYEFTTGATGDVVVLEADVAVLSDGTRRFEVASEVIPEWCIYMDRMSFDNGMMFSTEGRFVTGGGGRLTNGQLVDRVPFQEDLPPPTPININALAVELYSDIRGIRDLGLYEKEVIFTLQDMLTDALDAKHELVYLIQEAQAEGDEDQYGILVTRESVAKNQLRRYGASTEFINRYWQSYVDQGSVAMCFRGESGGEIDQLRLAEANWYRSIGRRPIEVAGYTISDIWSERFNESARVIARATALELIMDAFDKDKLSAQEILKNTSLVLYNKLKYMLVYIDPAQQGFMEEAMPTVQSDVQYYDSRKLIRGSGLPFGWVLRKEFFDDFILRGKVSYKRRNQINSKRGVCVAMEPSLANIIGRDPEGSSQWTYWRRTIGFPERSRASGELMTAMENVVYKELLRRKNQYRSIVTSNEIALEVVKNIIPFWSFAENVQAGDAVNAALDAIGDIMSLLPVAGAGYKAATIGTKGVKVGLKVASTASKLSRASKAISVSVQTSSGRSASLFARVAKSTRMARTVNVLRAVSVESLLSVSNLDTVADLARLPIKLGRSSLRLTRSLPAIGSSKFRLAQTTLKPVKLSDLFDDMHGMPLRHRNAFAQVARTENVILGVRPVDRSSSSLLDSDLYSSKGLRVKGKSSDWGPMAGFIPVDQSFAKASVSTDPSKIADFNGKVTWSIQNNHAISAPLVITTSRLDELVEMKLIRYDRNVSGNRIYTTDTPIAQTFRLDNMGNDQWKVLYKGADGNYQDLNVLASPITGKPLTADYDLLSVIHRIEDHGTLDQESLFYSWEEFRAQIDRYYTSKGHPIPTEYSDLYHRRQSYDSLGDDELGVISDRIRGIKNELNSAMGRTDGYELVHHGADESNPYSIMKDNFPALFFVPSDFDASAFFRTSDGALLIHNKRELLRLYQQAMDNHFVAWRNPAWGEEFRNLTPSWYQQAREALMNNL